MRYRSLLLTVLLVGSMGTIPVARGEDVPLPADQFENLHAMLKPRPGESRWMEIDWHPSVWEARQKAAREGKPLFIWAGSEGAPPAGC